MKVEFLNDYKEIRKGWVLDLDSSVVGELIVKGLVKSTDKPLTDTKTEQIEIKSLDNDPTLKQIEFLLANYDSIVLSKRSDLYTVEMWRSEGWVEQESATSSTLELAVDQAYYMWDKAEESEK